MCFRVYMYVFGYGLKDFILCYFCIFYLHNLKKKHKTIWVCCNINNQLFLFCSSYQKGIVLPKLERFYFKLP